MGTSGTAESGRAGAHPDRAVTGGTWEIMGPDMGPDSGQGWDPSKWADLPVGMP
jgi:hypothetical protein